MRPMSLNQYQQEALRTAIGDESEAREGLQSNMMLCWALGLAGEAGEFADRIKKEYFHRHPEDSIKRMKELGDVLWYLSVAAHEAGFSLEEVAQENLRKLRARYPDGFSSKASIERKEEEDERHAGV